MSIDLLGGVLEEQRRRCADKRSFKTRKWTATYSKLILRISGVLRANLTLTAVIVL